METFSLTKDRSLEHLVMFSRSLKGTLEQIVRFFESQSWNLKLSSTEASFGFQVLSTNFALLKYKRAAILAALETICYHVHCKTPLNVLDALFFKKSHPSWKFC